MRWNFRLGPLQITSPTTLAGVIAVAMLVTACCCCLPWAVGAAD